MKTKLVKITKTNYQTNEEINLGIANACEIDYYVQGYKLDEFLSVEESIEFYTRKGSNWVFTIVYK